METPSEKLEDSNTSNRCEESLADSVSGEVVTAHLSDRRDGEGGEEEKSGATVSSTAGAGEVRDANHHDISKQPEEGDDEGQVSRASPLSSSSSSTSSSSSSSSLLPPRPHDNGGFYVAPRDHWRQIVRSKEAYEASFRTEVEDHKAVNRCDMMKSDKKIRFYDHLKFRSLIGLFIVSSISLTYYTASICSLYYLFMALIFRNAYHVGVIVLLVTLSVLPIVTSDAIRSGWLFSCVAEYFNADLYAEAPPQTYLERDKPLLVLCWPHGVISFGGLAAAVMNPPVYGVTAVADVVLRIPFLRQVFGVFGMISSSRESIHSQLAHKRNVLLYPGGMAELFLSNFDSEEIYFRNRKGCVKLAIESGADVLPCFIIGNTHMFRVVRHSRVRSLSRWLRSSLTLFWGRMGLPIPFRTKVIFAAGTPLDIPHLQNPSTQLVEETHSLVMSEVERLYYKARLHHPEYMKKPLTIH